MAASPRHSPIQDPAGVTRTSQLAKLRVAKDQSSPIRGIHLLGLAWWHQVSGDEQALDLARKLANFIMLPKFWGRDNAATMPMDRERGHFNTHLHARMIALRGLLQFAMATDDRQIKDFVRFSYEYTRTLGIPRLGYFTLADHSEGCSLGDMTAMAVKLSDAGVGDYWDDVDCIARNLLVEQQLVRADLLEQIAESGPSSDRLVHNGESTTGFRE